jgi:hypothetical protein
VFSIGGKSSLGAFGDQSLNNLIDHENIGINSAVDLENSSII